MTPTPDPPPAAPLTAEEIAAIQERSEATRFVLDANAHRVDEPPWFLWYRCHETQLDEASLLASDAALRDRLARSEAEIARMREAEARFRDAAMLLASLTDYVEGEGISAHVWYQEFFWAIADIQECVTEIEPDYTDAALTILRRANERHPYRTRHRAVLATPTDGAARAGDAAEGQNDDTDTL